MLKATRLNRHLHAALVALAVMLGWPVIASAQLDPLLFLKRTQPNVIVVVDVANRMQRDAPTDPSNYRTTSNYYDPWIYTGSLISATQQTELGLTGNMNTQYRRKYVGLDYANSGSGDKFNAASIAGVGDLSTSFASFETPTRLAIARAAIDQAIRMNQNVARFGLVKMRQGNNLALATNLNSGPVNVADTVNQAVGDLGGVAKWSLSRPTVTSNNGAASTSGVLVLADAANANTTILATLAKDTRTSGGLLPAGNDDANTTDTPVKLMLDDTRSEAARLIGADAECRNTIVVLIVGGGEGNTTSGANPATTASTFLNVSSQRVPIYVIAIAPPKSDVTQLQDIASNSGGQYFEVTKAMIDAALASPMQPVNLAPPTGTVIVPDMVQMVNVAVQHAFAEFADFNPASQSPVAPTKSEFQVTSPVIGTVNLKNGLYIDGTTISDGEITNPTTTNVVPQRSNIMVTTGFSLPGFDGQLHAFRVYKPVADSTKPSGFKFVSDGRRLWNGYAPAAASRNIYTVTPGGTMTAFTSANAAALAPYMNTTTADAARIIDAVRGLPPGPFVGSTPAIMDAPSVDPPPDPEYPGFADANKDRRTMVWVGGNRGMMHAFDARLGVEAWAFIPFNLLPKLKTVMVGKAVGSFDYLVDGSAKVADVRVSSPCPSGVATCWRTYMFFGEGPGGTFYQAFDVTMDDMGTVVSQDSNVVNDVLSYFSNPGSIAFKWGFPSYQNFDYTLAPYGDIKSTAPTVEKTVGETWSDPAVGQIENQSGTFAVVTGSGFFSYSKQSAANRGGVIAGSTFYLLNVETGAVFDSRDVGNDNKAENVDNCALANPKNCEEIKNALQTDPVATGPPDSRYITKGYIGDLDGKLWRFDLGMVTGVPKIKTAPTKLYDAGANQPLFASMATVNVGNTQQYIFYATGSDLLPTDQLGVLKAGFKLLGVLDTGGSGSNTFTYSLPRAANRSSEEKATVFPAVAGDIVFFTTTTFHPATPCILPDANLYAVTFVGGPAYDNTGDNLITKADTTKVKTVTGARATAPFIVDQHLMFGAGGKVELFGDKEDYNNGVGQVGVRTLSWREVR